MVHLENLIEKTELQMPKCYWIAHPTITNKEKFMSEYVSKVGEVVEKYGGKFLVRGGEVTYREGDAASLDVVIEWPSRVRAMECNDSPEYKSIVGGRINNSTGMFIIVDGV